MERALSYPGAVRLKRVRFRAVRFFSRPEKLLGLGLLAFLAVLILIPLFRIVLDSLTFAENDLNRFPGARAGSITLAYYARVFTSSISGTLFYEPLLNSLKVATGVTILSLSLGSSLAWLLVRTDLPYKRFITNTVVLPYMMPSWVIALAWLALFQTQELGGQAGMVSYYFGFDPPVWLAYGPLPIIVSLSFHYYAYAFLLVASALISVDARLEESAQILGANRWRVLRKITFPLVLPALGSAFILTFVKGLGTFGTPYLLGIPVRFYVLSSRLYVSLQNQLRGEAFIMALALVLLAALIIYVNTRIIGLRKSFTTIGGKGLVSRSLRLGRWRRPLGALVICFIFIFGFGPLLVLGWESVMLYEGTYALKNFSLHYWIGASDFDFADGTPGLFLLSETWASAWNSIRLSGLTALITGFLGILIGYSVVRDRGTTVARCVDMFTFLPYVFPAIAFAGIYLSMFAKPVGPLPSLYGTFTLLVLISTVKCLPYSSRTGIAAMMQLDPDLEDAAKIHGASWVKRLWRIILPLTKSGFIAGMVLIFISTMRELSLIILLITPETMPLTAFIFRLQDSATDNFQHACAGVLILVGMIILCGVVIQKLRGHRDLERIF